MKICAKFNDLAFPVTLSQSARKLFTVEYGAQIKRGLTYSEAAHELGACLMHAMACNGDLDNSGK